MQIYISNTFTQEITQILDMKPENIYGLGQLHTCINL